MAASRLKLKTFPAVTVATAGTRVQLIATETMVYSLAIQSLSSNTGSQYVGDNTVSSTNGMLIIAGECAEIDAPVKGQDQFDASQIYFDSSTNGAEFRIIGWIRG